MDWPKKIEALVTTLFLAIVVPFFANWGASLTEFYGRQRLFFTEVQDHAPLTGKKYVNVISLINGSGHKFQEIILNLKSSTPQGNSSVTRCFFDEDGVDGNNKYNKCPFDTINTGKYSITLTPFSAHAKFSIIVESDNEFEVGGMVGKTKTENFGITVNINGDKQLIKKLNRNYILTWPFGYIWFSLISLVIGIPIFLRMRARSESFFSKIKKMMNRTGGSRRSSNGN
jgi:hypothetical protein